jgi:predicted amidohydrolase
MTSVQYRTVRIAAAQTAEYRGDVGGAIRCLIDVVEQAEARDVKLICFPEGFLQGYLTEETSARGVAMGLGSPEFLAILEQLPAGPMLVFGMIEMDGEGIFNTAVVVQNGIVVGRYRKAHIMGGESVFLPGTDSPTFVVDGLRFGINICYDANFPIAAARVAAGGASLVVCPANNMMQSDKAERYRDLHNAVRGERCRETGLWLISADVTGGRGGRVALGPTAVLNPAGDVEAQLPLGKPGLLIFDLPVDEAAARYPSS